VHDRDETSETVVGRVPEKMNIIEVGEALLEEVNGSNDSEDNLRPGTAYC
jgi:hypothetical protein